MSYLYDYNIFRKKENCAMKSKKPSMLIWDDDGPDVKGISIEPCDWFNARGMNRIYTRAASLTITRIIYKPYSLTFNLDLWRNKSGGIFTRFWSRCRSWELDDEFREIRGWEPSECAEILPDNLVPLQIRLGYNELAWENY